MQYPQQPQQPFPNFNISNSEQEMETTSLKKILILQCSNYNYYEEFPVQIPYNSEKRQLDIGYVITNIFKRVFIYQKTVVQIFCRCFRTGYYQYLGVYPFEERVYLNRDFIDQKQIQIMFKTFALDDNSGVYGFVSQQIMEQKYPVILNYQQEYKSPYTQKANNSLIEVTFPGNPSLLKSHMQNLKGNCQQYPIQKKKRVKNRTIKEALQKVAEWRSLPQQSLSEEKLTLQEAAKMVGVPKKTLDDYYYQIKTGQTYGFDFQGNMNERIGVLRTFVKFHHKKKELGNKNEEYNDLKILHKYMYPEGEQGNDIISGFLDEKAEKQELQQIEEIQQQEYQALQGNQPASPQCQFEDCEFEEQEE